MPKSTKPLIRVHNQETDEVIDREMTDAEYAAFQEQKAINDAKQAELDAKAEAKAELLARLGITAEEATLLLS
jgi:hypothetical protein